MIDPEKVTNYNQTDKELEEFILFWVCAAGKNGRTAARCLDKFLYGINGLNTPFTAIRRWSVRHSNIPEMMKSAGIGCYYGKSATFLELVLSKINLHTCTAGDLESIYGIGPKTARCFLLHSREDAQVAGLDTHMLKHLRVEGHDVPKSTPTGKKYLTLEKAVLSLAKEAGMSPASYDLMIWNRYSTKSTPKG
jgi:hypothetical protein